MSKPTFAIEIAGVPASQLTDLAVAHRQALRFDAPESITTTDSHGDLFVTNDGATENFRVRTMRLTLDGVNAFMAAFS